MTLALTTTDRLTLERMDPDAKRDFDYWRPLIEPVLRAPHHIHRKLHQIAAETGQPYATVRKRYYRARKHGLLALVDRRLCSALWKRKRAKTTCPITCCPGLIQLWKRLCEENKRKSRPEYDRLVKMWRTRHPDIAAIPEYRDFPGWPKLPEGWSYKNLMKHGPSDFELLAARTGRFAAAAERPTVLTTRKGLYVGSHYLLDDKWHDFFVNTFAEKQHGRPLEVYSFDLFSARKLDFTIRVRTKDQEGNYQGIGEIMTRYTLAATLYGRGYSPRGTVLVAEHGTAAISGKIADALRDLSGGLLTLSESGMTGDPAFVGQYPGLVKGNPRHKAALESNNNLEHNHFGALPGQTGNSVANRPEELHGRLHHNAMLLAAYAELSPERAALLEFPLLELNQFLDVAQEVYARIAHTRVHELEGWIESGNILQAFEFGGKLITELDLTAEQKAALPQLLQTGLLNARPVRMTRQEVWDRGRRDLVRLPGWGVVAILGDDLAREARVVDNMFTIRDADIGPGNFYFEPFIVTPEGRTEQLRDQEAYDVFINPLAPETLFVRDAKKRYLGEARQIVVPSHGDEEGIRRAMGAAVKRESQLLAPLAARHARTTREKLRLHEANAAAAEDPQTVAPTGPEKRRQRDVNAQLAELARAREAGARDEP